MSPVIVTDREVMGAVAVFHGTRVPFQALLDYLEGGQSLDEFLDDFRRSAPKQQLRRWSKPSLYWSTCWDEFPAR